ncbi:hypothetical protein [Aquimarina litoralis]|uniref:hypothetical protein n=1 Tax=Aquimarina litoralis TaxID=584605 RepID=UPI001C5A2725|nr:hypothetical protein [Aquimarina litoralis]MBW1294167.1 hypothetical protein [Aquimarina litoralis]
MTNHLHKKLISKVDTIYEETPDDNPCAGSEIYLMLVFDEKQIHISEKEISSCNKSSTHKIGMYDWKLVSNNTIEVDFITKEVEGTYAEQLQLELRDSKVIGIITHLNGNEVEYVFKEITTI